MGTIKLEKEPGESDDAHSKRQQSAYNAAYYERVTAPNLQELYEHRRALEAAKSPETKRLRKERRNQKRKSWCSVSAGDATKIKVEREANNNKITARAWR